MIRNYGLNKPASAVLDLLPSITLMQARSVLRNDNLFAGSPANFGFVSPAPDSGIDLTKVPITSDTKNYIQPKLKLAQPDDRYEHEADRMAERVMDGKFPDTSPPDFSRISQSNGSIIQRQEKPDQVITEDFSPEVDSLSPSSPEHGSARVNRCFTNPEFPDFRCLTYALKLDVDENLWNNAHHFYRAAALFPDDNELMWNTFLKYGLGVNLLQTSFGFLGANETLGTALSYGTGIGLKSFEFFQNGVLQLDVPIEIRPGISLDLNLGLNANPENLIEIQGVNTSVGVRFHY